MLEFINIACNDKCFKNNLIQSVSPLHLKKCLAATFHNKGDYMMSINYIS